MGVSTRPTFRRSSVAQNQIFPSCSNIAFRMVTVRAEQHGSVSAQLMKLTREPT
jgi:hypothetical protein